MNYLQEDNMEFVSRFIFVIAFLNSFGFSLTSEDFGYGILYPRESESREIRSLDGLWNFRVPFGLCSDQGIVERWYMSDLSKTGKVDTMPVPSSYNDLTEKRALRDHIGVVWYDRRFFTPRHWAKENRRVFIRFGSVHYHTLVWMNGMFVTSHEGGHLPFLAEITAFLKFGKGYDRITVAVNNTLTSTTIPQGTIRVMNDTARYPKGYMIQSYNFDFFNYAGIHRPVIIYSTPGIYIDDINVSTNFENTYGQSNKLMGIVQFDVSIGGITNQENSVQTDAECQVTLYEGWDINGVGTENNAVASSFLCKSTIYIPEVKITVNEEKDVYRMPIGIRTLKWTNSNFLINGKPFYFRGFGKHEDSNIHGRGLNLPLIVKDNNLLYWIGANAFRTSHYPYSEETMDFADRLGIVVIDESPAIGIDNFTSNELLQKHKMVMTKLIRRDKNRPSVVLWSLSNEPLSQKDGADNYFRILVDHTKKLDQSRPVTFVTSQSYSNDKAVQYMDVICVNRYSSWYSDTGHSDLINLQTESELSEWHKKFKKPVIMTEYGAGSVVGLHSEPASVWTEEYHVITLKEHFKAFERLRKNGILIEYFRPGGCLKGVFTRDRKPKSAAHITRWRYWFLANQTSSVPLPSDLLYSLQ
ncbi:hypothetical protein J437_LFUL012024 [Ladona fulva]|uniref:Beta-glucuronidase n=1 Tax=Ladona fulva TaxID=123851 RepID=A0A8K0KCT9_LADFU|nr:hypothetical protein J437_LFUL012024 [Ladona fulva]